MDWLAQLLLITEIEKVVYIGLLGSSYLMKSHSFVTSISVVKSFWNFAQSMAVTLPCSVQNFRMIWQLKCKICAYEISTDLCLRWVSEGIQYRNSHPGTATCSPPLIGVIDRLFGSNVAGQIISDPGKRNHHEDNFSWRSFWHYWPFV